MEMTSPTRTSRPAFASWPLTITRPASQVSLAKLRRKITRLHFKNRSRRIGSILSAWGPPASPFRYTAYGRLFDWGNGRYPHTGLFAWGPPASPFRYTAYGRLFDWGNGRYPHTGYI